jgi:hypothetical protein
MQERAEARARGHFASKRRPSSSSRPSDSVYKPHHAAPHEDPFAAAEAGRVKQAAAYLGVARRR